MKFAIIENAVAALRETAVPLRRDSPRRSRPCRRLVGVGAAGFLAPVGDATLDGGAELIDVQRLAQELPYARDLRNLADIADGGGGDDDRLRQQVGRAAFQL